MIQVGKKGDFCRVNSKCILKQLYHISDLSDDEIWGYQWLQSNMFLGAKEKILCYNMNTYEKFLSFKGFQVSSFDEMVENQCDYFDIALIGIIELQEVNSILKKIYATMKPGGILYVLCKFDTFENLNKQVCKSVLSDEYELCNKTYNDSSIKNIKDCFKLLGIKLFKKFKIIDGYCGSFFSKEAHKICYVNEIFDMPENHFLKSYYSDYVRSICVGEELIDETFGIEEISKCYQTNITDSEQLFNELYSMNLIEIKRKVDIK